MSHARRASFLTFFFLLPLFTAVVFAEQRFKKTESGDYDFYSVMDTLLERFAADLNTVDRDIHKISLYKISLNGDLPGSFKETLASQISDIVTANSKIQMVKCVTCSKMRVTNDEGALVIRQGVSRMDELRDVSREIGVRVFMDATLSYHPEEMVFSASLFDAYRGDVLWSRSYSSKDLQNDRNYEIREKMGQEAMNLRTFRLIISPGMYLLPGQGGDKVGYLGMSLSLLEFMGGFLDHFGLTFSGFMPGAFGGEARETQYLIDAGGIAELRLYADLGGGKFRRAAYVGGGPLFSGNYQSFLGGLGANLDIGKKFGLTSSLFYIFKGIALQDEDFIDINGNQVRIGQETKGSKVGGLGFNFAFNIRW